jgi:hypothetical protein
VVAISSHINLAREGTDVALDIQLEYVPAVEHFANHNNAQIFLMAGFKIACLGKISHIERCLACYPKEKEEEKPQMMEIANARLKLLYDEFDRAYVTFGQRFFQ